MGKIFFKENNRLKRGRKLTGIAALCFAAIFLAGCNTADTGSLGSDSRKEEPSNENVHVDSPVINVMKTEMLAYGNFGGNLGQGWLFLALPEGEKHDYQVCFVRSEDKGDRYKPLEEALTEAETVDYVFPDVRDGNTPIGKFVELYLYETFAANEKSGMVLVAIYEADDDRYYDTRVYTEDDGGYGYAVNEFMAAELNQKYHNAEEDYPIWQVLAMPTD